jgi:hypothetical protein
VHIDGAPLSQQGNSVPRAGMIDGGVSVAIPNRSDETRSRRTAITLDVCTDLLETDQFGLNLKFHCAAAYFGVGVSGY